jgi:hypothetical protein
MDNKYSYNILKKFLDGILIKSNENKINREPIENIMDIISTIIRDRTLNCIDQNKHTGSSIKDSIEYCISKYNTVRDITKCYLKSGYKLEDCIDRYAPELPEDIDRDTIKHTVISILDKTNKVIREYMAWEYEDYSLE